MAKAKQSGEKLYAYSLRERLQLPKVNVSGEIVVLVVSLDSAPAP